MNYIVIDLEWNQSPLGKEAEVKEMPFEIIEIGAIKLDSDKKIIDTFHKLVKPQVYPELHHMTKDLIHIDMDELRRGIDFKDAAEKFLKWCGDEYIFCTWGDMDLTEFQKNLEYYDIYYFKKPIKFYDVQKIFALSSAGDRKPRTLEYAVDYFHITKEESFHRALCDAKYTALIFQKLELQSAEKNYSIDCYQNPKTKEEEIKVIYDSYSKYISSEFRTKEEAFENREVSSSICYKCGKIARKKIRWFSSNSKNYYCLAICRTHGYLRGKIRMKRATDGNLFVIKTLKLVDDEGAKDIMIRQEDLRKKRKVRKQKKKDDKKSPE